MNVDYITEWYWLKVRSCILQLNIVITSWECDICSGIIIAVLCEISIIVNSSRLGHNFWGACVCIRGRLVKEEALWNADAGKS